MLFVMVKKASGLKTLLRKARIGGAGFDGFSRVAASLLDLATMLLQLFVGAASAAMLFDHGAEQHHG
jgi:hypothetical protein